MNEVTNEFVAIALFFDGYLLSSSKIAPWRCSALQDFLASSTAPKSEADRCMITYEFLP